MNPELELRINTTNAGVYTVTYAYRQAPLDVQNAVFLVHNLEMVSPTEIGFLRAKQQKAVTTFNPYSRTRADVFYDNRGNSKVVIIPGGALSKIISLSDLVDAHRRGKEYIIPKSQRDLVYAMVDMMLKQDTAFVAPHGVTEVNNSALGKTELTSRLFSDERLGIQAQEYGDYQLTQGRTSQIIRLDKGDYSKSQKGPYLNRLRVRGPGTGFIVGGYYWSLDGNVGAFGVRFEKTAEGGAKKS